MKTDRRQPPEWPLAARGGSAAMMKERADEGGGPTMGDSSKNVTDRAA
jgi:hypothetical protein